MSSHLEGRVVVITGAAGGFGRILAVESVKRGAAVVGCDIDEAGLAETSELAGGITTVIADVADRAQMQAVAAAAVDAHGAIDVMINNAGTMPLAFFADHERAADAWERCIDINLKGVLNGIIAVHDQMISQGRGHVVNLSSIYGNQPVVGAAVYGATKAAVAFMSEALRQESRGAIKVTTVRPTGVPGTGLGGAVVNRDAIIGIVGANMADYAQAMGDLLGGDPPDEITDPESPGYVRLGPEQLVDQIMYAIDQPWGVAISDVTVRAMGDHYII